MWPGTAARYSKTRRSGQSLRRRVAGGRREGEWITDFQHPEPATRQMRTRCRSRSWIPVRSNGRSPMIHGGGTVARPGQRGRQIAARHPSKSGRHQLDTAHRARPRPVAAISAVRVLHRHVEAANVTAFPGHNVPSEELRNRLHAFLAIRVAATSGTKPDDLAAYVEIISESPIANIRYCATAVLFR